jgi:3-oxoacyl-[acyl-carrier protein] reductase
MSVADTTALVVSGTSGSGSEVVRKIAAAGGTVGFTYNAAADEADALLDEIDGEHEVWQCDVTDGDDVGEVVDEAFETLGEIDTIVYTVGVISRSSVDELEAEDWQAHLDANVTRAYNLINAAAPHLKAQGEGAIAALSASEGVLRSDQLGAYDASKRGLEALIAETARDLGPHGIRANVVAPGYIRDPDALSADQRADLLEQVPYEHITAPGDIADACLYLCSGEAAAVTGAVLPVDSGLAL